MTGTRPGQSPPVPHGIIKTGYSPCSLKEKETLLELYNALNGSAYTDTSDMTVTTLENAVYIGMKNDVVLCVSGSADDL